MQNIYLLLSLTLYLIINPLGGSGLLHVNVTLNLAPTLVKLIKFIFRGAVGTIMTSKSHMY